MKEREVEFKQEVIKESKRLQKVVITIGIIIISLIAICIVPPLLPVGIFVAIVWGLTLICKIVYALITRTINKIINTKDKRSLLPVYVLKIYDYSKDIILKYKKDWFKITVIILLILILLKSL